jgi:hypothetical protein
MEVDGIVSGVLGMPSYATSPMIQFLDDRPSDYEWFRQRWDCPPSEAELDAWVADGDDRDVIFCAEG